MQTQSQFVLIWFKIKFHEDWVSKLLADSVFCTVKSAWINPCLESLSNIEIMQPQLKGK